METRARYIMVGSFFLILLTAVVIVVLWLARVEFKQRVSFFDIYFPGSVTGLNRGSVVRDNGIPVGRVTEVKLDPQDPGRVRITVEIESGTVIQSDAVAALEIQGLTGGAFINISGGSRDSPPLVRESGQRYPVIASAQSGLQRVVASAPEALGRVIALADQLSDVFNEQNRTAIADTLENVRRLTATVASHTGEIDGAISDGATALHDLRSTLETANAILSSLNQVIGPSSELADAIKSVNATSQKFGDVAQHLNAILDDNSPQLHDFTRRGLDQLQQLVSQTQQLVAQLSRLADTIARDPSRIIYGDRRQGYQPK
jgi:phospholipid/cholesterol/gamma-HCH transport system substrate-binding protein